MNNIKTIRKQRMAKALRENLLKRKSQQQLRQEQSTDHNTTSNQDENTQASLPNDSSVPGEK